MKKIYFCRAFLYLMALAIAGNTVAQGNLKRANPVIAKEKEELPLADKINTRAVRDFNRSYKNALDVQWTRLMEGGHVCHFSNNNISARAYYNVRGKWLYTVSTYGEDKLPAGIRFAVKTVYFDYAISCVNEINRPGNKALYIIQVQDNNVIKFLQANEDGMEIVREIHKL